MKLTVSDSIWLDDELVCSIEHLVEVSGLTRIELEELINVGLVAPMDAAAEPPAFSLSNVVTATVGRRLRDDFELDCNGMVLAMTLLQRIEQLQREVDALRPQPEPS